MSSPWQETRKIIFVARQMIGDSLRAARDQETRWRPIVRRNHDSCIGGGDAGASGSRLQSIQETP